MTIFQTERPRTKEIKEIINENYRVKTFIIEDEYIAKKAKPGQFVMIWIPGVDEIPISISGANNKEIMITVARVGEATNILHKKREGDIIGIRGPYGKPFSIGYRKVLMVGGGYGVAPLIWLAEVLTKKDTEIHFIIGAKKSEDIILYNRIKDVANEVTITTEDGSRGLKGLATDAVEDILSKKTISPEIIYTCGPEKMMVKIVDLALERGIHVEASFERYIKCGIGICGSCAIGHLRICVEGPVLSESEIKQVRRYIGKEKLDPSSRKIKI